MIRIAGLALAALTIAVPAANAAVMQATFGGTIYSGYDTTGEFGSAGTDLANLGVSWTITYDTSVGNISGPGLEQVAGGVVYGPPSPVISSIVTINGQSRSLRTGYSSFVYVTDNDLFGSEQFSAYSSENLYDCVGDICTYSLDIASALTYGLLEYLPDSLDQPFTVGQSLDVNFYGYFVTRAYTYNSATGEYSNNVNADGRYRLDSLAVSYPSAVPLPASFSLILAALGGLAGMRAFGRRKLNAV